jgi:hypothetical protein
MKTQKTILAALTRGVQFTIQKTKFPIVVSIKKPQQEVSFDGFRDMQRCLSSVAAMRINPEPIKLNVKLRNNVQIERVNFGAVFNNQHTLLQEILVGENRKMKEDAINQWNKRSGLIYGERKTINNNKRGTIRDTIETILMIVLLIAVITTVIITIITIF